MNKKIKLFKFPQRLKKIILSIGFIFGIPQIAFAQTAVAEIIGYGCSWLSGEVGACVGVAIIIFSGYEALNGKIEKEKAFYRAVGIGLIIGGSYIATDIFHIGGY